MGLGNWVWLGRTRLKCFSKRLLNEFPNWSMFNCKTLIFSFTPIEIVFQRDLWWWTRRQILPFIQFLSRFFNLSTFYNTIGWKCSLKNNCVRSCLIEHYSFFDSKINIDPKYSHLDVSSIALCMYRARRGAEKSIYSGSL